MRFYKITFNIYEKSLILGLIFSILFSIVNFSSKCDIVREKVLRLHVIANSDSEEDQSLKFKVRNKVIEYFSGQNFKNLEEAKKFSTENKINIQNLCQKEIYNQGFNYKVNVDISKYGFNTRIYDRIALPAGLYNSIRILIGEGKGKNWWCVVFPQMCIPAAEDCNVDQNAYDDIFSESDKNLIENEEQYKVKFKIVEVIESIHEKIVSILEDFMSLFS